MDGKEWANIITWKQLVNFEERETTAISLQQALKFRKKEKLCRSCERPSLSSICVLAGISYELSRICQTDYILTIERANLFPVQCLAMIAIEFVALTPSMPACLRGNRDNSIAKCQSNDHLRYIFHKVLDWWKFNSLWREGKL